MQTFQHIPLLVAGLFGASGVALGAFGAHALKDVLDARGAALWQTATQYHLLHAAALLAAAATLGPAPKGLRLGVLLGFALGTLLFSGTLYAMALGAPRWFGAVTPVGGVLLIVGWLALSALTARG